MTTEKRGDGGESRTLKRRTVLSIGAGTAGAVAGIGAFAGTAAAWDDLDADFRGCSQVRILASENDLNCLGENGEEFDGSNDQCPLIVAVIVASGNDVECRPVEMTEENATTIPGQYGNRPLVRYRASGGEKILGIMGLSPSRNPLCSTLIENDNRCAETPNTPSIDEADCVPTCE